MSIREIDPSDIFIEESAFKEYQKGLEFLWQEIVYLNTNFFILEKLIDFPAGWLAGPNKTDFFNMVKSNFLDNCILAIHRSYLDTGTSRDPVYTLKILKNHIAKYMKPKFKDEFFSELKKVETAPSKVENALERIKDLRNKRLAHLDKNIVFNLGALQALGISFQELKDISDYLTKFFALLCFGHGYAVLPVEYFLAKQKDKEDTDVDYLLNLLVQDSRLFDLPEREPELWELYKRERNIPQSVIDTINKFRKRNNLPMVDW